MHQWVEVSIKASPRPEQNAQLNQMTFWTAFYWTKCSILWFQFHWGVFPAANQHWFRYWLGDEQETWQPLLAPLITQLSDEYMHLRTQWVIQTGILLRSWITWILYNRKILLTTSHCFYNRSHHELNSVSVVDIWQCRSNIVETHAVFRYFGNCQLMRLLGYPEPLKSNNTKTNFDLAIWRMIFDYCLWLGYRQEQWFDIQVLCIYWTGTEGINQLLKKVIYQMSVPAWSSSWGDFVRLLAYSDPSNMAYHGAMRKPNGVMMYDKWVLTKVGFQI